jgi:hypothetical protein
MSYIRIILIVLGFVILNSISGYLGYVLGYVALVVGVIMVAIDKTEKNMSLTGFIIAHSFCFAVLIWFTVNSFTRYSQDGIPEFAMIQLVKFNIPIIILSLGFTVLNFRSVDYRSSLNTNT